MLEVSKVGGESRSHFLRHFQALILFKSKSGWERHLEVSLEKSQRCFNWKGNLGCFTCFFVDGVFFWMTEKPWDENHHEITSLDNCSSFFPSPFCRLRDTQGDTYDWWPNGWQFVWRLAVLKRRSPLNGFPGNPKRTIYLECFFCYNYNCICLLSVRVCSQQFQGLFF